MVQAPLSASTPPRPRPRWQVPLLAGVCFGLGYGLTHRLLVLQLPSLVRLGEGFEVRPFPGTSLESLRLRFGDDSQEVRGNLAAIRSYIDRLRDDLEAAILHAREALQALPSRIGSSGAGLANTSPCQFCTKAMKLSSQTLARLTSF